jgi:Ca2+-binding RTX toxin-like protein
MPGKTIFGTDLPETIDASDGVTSQGDTISEYGGGDFLYGLGGDDWLKGGGGADRLDGGPDTDTADYSDSPAGVTVDLSYSLMGSGGTAEGDTLFSIENLIGSRYGDYLIGSFAANYLSGGRGNDELRGSLGTDTLIGGAGDDELEGGEHADILNGGADVDTVSYYFSRAGVSVDLGRGTGRFGEAEGDTLIDIENVTGSSHDDVLVGSDVANRLVDNFGYDDLYGFGGADTLIGGSHNDTLDGGSNVDAAGAWGYDTLRGGVGADTFIWSSIDHTGTTLDRIDRIEDFNRAGGDWIDVRPIDADATVPGNQDFIFIGEADFSGPGQIRVFRGTDNTWLRLNVDADLDPMGDAVIRLNGAYTPDASWFMPLT